MSYRGQGRTIGDVIKKLVEEFGKDTSGIWMLERALADAVGAKGYTVKIDDKLVHQYERYRELYDEEAKALERVQGLIDDGRKVIHLPGCAHGEWYVSDIGDCDWEADPVFVDCGNGLEPKADYIRGPFESEQAARAAFE
jgi:hypothetical protein